AFPIFREHNRARAGGTVPDPEALAGGDSPAPRDDGPAGLVERSRIGKQGIAGGNLGAFHRKVCDALAKRQMEVNLHEANEIAALTTTVAVEEVLGRINVERGAGLRMEQA